MLPGVNTYPKFVGSPVPGQVPLVYSVQFTVHDRLHIQHVSLHEVNELITHLREVGRLLGESFCQPLWGTVLFGDLVCSAADVCHGLDWRSLQRGKDSVPKQPQCILYLKY